MNINDLREEILSLIRSVDKFTLIVATLDKSDEIDDFNTDLQEDLILFGQIFNIDFCQHCGAYFLMEDLKSLLCTQCDLELRNQ